LMGHLEHEEFHSTIGTYKKSGNIIGNSYALASTIAANRRPNLEQIVIADEDLPTTLSILTSKLYTKFYLTSTLTANYIVETADVIPLSTNNPFYNKWNGSAWVQTLMPANSLASVWIYAIPVCSDNSSQKYRFLFVQPQWITQSSNSSAANLAIALSNELLRQPSELVLNSVPSFTSEFIAIGRIVVQYTGGNWTLVNVSNLSGTRYTQVGSPSGNYLSSVSTSGSSFSGNGTGESPLTSVYLDGFIDYTDAATQTTPINYTAPDAIEIPCDGLGAYTVTAYKPLNVTNLWNTTTNRIDLSELNLGDEFTLCVELEATTLSNNPLFEVYATFDLTGSPYTKKLTTDYYKVAGTYNIAAAREMYIGFAGTKNNPAAIYFKCDVNCTLKVIGIFITVKRRPY